MSSNIIPKTILLRGDPIGAEAAAGAANILPGMLLAVNSAGAVIPHGVSGGQASKLFAREEEYAGGGVETAYANGDRVPYWSCRSGDQVFAILADGHNVAVGDYLQSNGDGTLRPVVAASQSGTTPFAYTAAGIPVARAIQAVNTSGGATATARIKVEII